MSNLQYGRTVAKKNDVLFTIGNVYLLKDKKESPSNLIEKIGLAKSNLTILCNAMIKEGLLEKSGKLIK